MQDVADAAGAPKPVFYRIFASRAELIDALFQHVHDTIVETQKGKWDGYGWALKVLYLEARKDPEIFLVVLKVFRGDPAWEPWRQKLLLLVSKQAETVFRPADDAPPGGEKRAVAAARTVNAWVFEVLVSWLEDDDGLERRGALCLVGTDCEGVAPRHARRLRTGCPVATLAGRAQAADLTHFLYL